MLPNFTKQAAVATLALSMAMPVASEERPSVAPKNMQAIAPGLANYTDQVLFGDVWERTQLSPRDRSLVTVSTLIATGKTAQLSGHLGRGLNNGIKPSEVAGIVTHLAFYTGWPNAVSALGVIEQTFAERKIDPTTWRPVPAAKPLTRDPKLETATPKFTQLTDGVIFNDLWLRTDLSPRDRSLVTIAILAANGDTDQLGFYIDLGIKHGLTQTEITEALTHIAFYAGWPKATSALAIATKMFEAKKVSSANGNSLQHVPPGQTPTAGPSRNFTGSVVVTSPFKGTGDARLGGATVTFAPGAHSNWHSHPLGQLLVITEGSGWVQVEGEPVQALRPGDVVWTAPGVKHWHGATRATSLTHVAISEALDGKSVTWMEPLADKHYPAQ